MISFSKSVTIDESKKAARNFNPFLNAIIAYGLTFLGSLLTVIPGIFAGIIISLTNPNTNIAELSQSPEMDAFSLIARAILIVVVILFCMLLPKKNMRSLGFTKEKLVPEYIKGLIIGFAMFSGTVAILIVTKQISSLELTNVSIPLLIFFFIGYMVQGASEEVACRGYLLTSVAARNGIFWGIMVNSVLFSLLHIFNNGFTILPFINIVLFGIFMSVYFLRSDSIWGVCAIHSIWNFAQGNFYGISVSGGGLSPSVFVPTSFKTSIISGGAFGAEGGLAVTIILIVSILLVLYIPKKTDSVSQSPSVNN